MSKHDYTAIFDAVAEIPELKGKPLSALNERIRVMMGPRGGRFNGDHADICMFIERSRNINVVVYRANFVHPPSSGDANETLKAFFSSTAIPPAKHPPTLSAVQSLAWEKVEEADAATCHINPSDGIHPYFINLVPSYIAERRRKGIMHDTSDLKYIEKTLAYGCNVKPIPLADYKAAVEKAGKKSKDKSKGSDGVVEWASQIFEGGYEPHVANYVALSKWVGIMLAVPPLEGEQAKAVDEKRSSAVEKRKKEAESVSQEEKDRKAAAEKKLMEEEGNDWHMESAKGDRIVDECKATRTTPAILCIIGGVISVAEKVFVKSFEPKHFYQLPRVEYVEVFGYSLVDGSQTYEKIEN